MSKALKVAGALSGAAVTVTGTAMFATPAHASVVVTWEQLNYKKYLEIYQSGGSNGNWADIYSWNGGNNQKWSAVDLGYDSRGDTQWAFINVNSQKCLEDFRYETTGHVDQWSCGNYGDNARWQEIYNPFGNSPPGNSYSLQDYGNGEHPCADLSSHFWVMWASIGQPACLWG